MKWFSKIIIIFNPVIGVVLPAVSAEVSGPALPAVSAKVSVADLLVLAVSSEATVL